MNKQAQNNKKSDQDNYQGGFKPSKLNGSLFYLFFHSLNKPSPYKPYA